MALKILLIKVNILGRKEFDSLSKVCPPIGLCYIAASLLQIGANVKIIDMVAMAPSKKWEYSPTHYAFGITIDELVDKVRDFCPDLIGIGGFTNQFGLIKRVVDALKSAFAFIPIILGGACATTLPKTVMKKMQVDYILRGESDKSIVELVSNIVEGSTKKMNEVDGLGYRNGSDIIINKKKYFESSINSLPWPARELLDHKSYMDSDVAMPVITSRGCPGRCAFCCVQLSAGLKWRPRDPYDVVDEIEDLVSKWGYRTISIFDDAANVNTERLIKICQEIVNRNINVRITFPGSLILRFVTKELLFWMKQAGTVALSLPIEHANTYMRNQVIKKGLKDEQIDRVLFWCRELHILTVAHFVIGMPGETEDSLKEIVQYVKDNASRLDAVSVYFATPFPSTEFYDTCIKKGLLKDEEFNDFLDFDTYTVHIKEYEDSEQVLIRYKKMINDTFMSVKGPDFPADRIRCIMRKPDEDGLDYLHNIYFKEIACKNG